MPKRKTSKIRKVRTASQLDKSVLKLWSIIVKAQGMNKCEKCGSSKFLNAHHIYGRTNYNVRYDIDNGACLCPGCHKWRRDSAHNAPLEFIELMINKRGQAWYLKLQKKAMRDIFKIDKEDIEKELKKKVALLEGK